MGGQKKRKNESEDFQVCLIRKRALTFLKKKKLKVGRKVAPQNQTSIAHVAKAITLLSQRALDEKDVAVNKNSLTLKQLLGLCKHNNQHRRKGANPTDSPKTLQTPSWA